MTGHADERGALTAFLAVMAVALFALVGLVLDGGRAIGERSKAMDVAEQAARMGADQLSVDALRQGAFVVDPEAASSAAQRYLAELGETGTVEVSGDVVTVHVEAHSPTAILGMIGIRDIPVSATATATNVHGVTREDR